MTTTRRFTNPALSGGATACEAHGGVLVRMGYVAGGADDIMPHGWCDFCAAVPRAMPSSASLDAYEWAREGAVPAAAPAAAVPAPILVATVRPRPIVSVVLPTFDRPDLLAHAIDRIASQTYDGQLEIVVADSSPGAVAEEVAMSDRLVLRTLPAPGLGAGDARRAGAEAAHGDFIVHWNDDDWYAPDRIVRQLAWLREKHVPACFTCTFYQYEPKTRKCAIARYGEASVGLWATVGTIAETKEHAATHPIPQLEDEMYWRQYRDVSPAGNMRDAGLWILMAHASNSYRKGFGMAPFKPADPAEAERIMGPEETAYWQGAAIGSVAEWADRDTPHHELERARKAARQHKTMPAAAGKGGPTAAAPGQPAAAAPGGVVSLANAVRVAQRRRY